MRWQNLVCVALFGLTAISNAESARVIKVLPHLLDLRGRHTISPSLYDRDAYQAELRANPAKRSGLRFDVQWKAEARRELTLHAELRSIHQRQTETLVLDKQVTPGKLSQWSSVAVTGQDYQQFGDLLAWRVTLWDGTNQLAEAKSFLW